MAGWLCIGNPPIILGKGPDGAVVLAWETRMLHLRKIDTEDVLWNVYWHGRSQTAFNRLVEFYLPWVKRLATRHGNNTPYNVDWQDMFQDGSIALLDCIQRFN